MSQDRSFERYIREWIRQYRTADRLATAIGMSLSAFSRGVRNEQTLGVVSCLRFAKETGEPPSKVLRLAGKGDVAKLIEELYGPQAVVREPLSGALREDVERWKALTDAERASLRTLMTQLLAARERTRRSR